MISTSLTLAAVAGDTSTVASASASKTDMAAGATLFFIVIAADWSTKDVRPTTGERFVGEYVDVSDVSLQSVVCQ